MKLIGVQVEPVRHALRPPLRSASGDLLALEGFRLRLRDESGASGRGEVLTSARTESLAAAGQAIFSVVPLCDRKDYGLSGFLDVLGEVLPGEPGARCAFDCAAHELEAELRGTRVAALLTDELKQDVGVSALIGAEDVTRSVEEARAARARGYRTLDLKLGRDEPEADATRVAAVRAVVGPDVRLRVDGQGAWTADRALELLGLLAGSGVELAIDPVHALDLEAQQHVHEQSPLPIGTCAALAAEEARAAFLEGALGSVALDRSGAVRGPARGCPLRPPRGAQRRGVRDLERGLGTHGHPRSPGARGRPARPRTRPRPVRRGPQRGALPPGTQASRRPPTDLVKS